VNIDKMKISMPRLSIKLAASGSLAQAECDGSCARNRSNRYQMSSVIKVHLSARKIRFLSSLSGKGERSKAKTMSVNFQREMADIVAEYEKFSVAGIRQMLINCDEAFRRDANVVLRKVHERMQREGS
jgi:hypothetical protein